MRKILIIDATGRSNQDSRTKLLSEAVIAKLDTNHAQVEYLDLYQEEIPYLNQEILTARVETSYQTPLQLQALKYVEQFEAADLHVFIYPVWNWSIPAILKAYLDLIMISNRNFKYQGWKIIGQLTNKEAILISTAGGPLVNKFFSRLLGMENPNLYMQKMLKILGIKQVTTISIGGMSYRFKNKDTNTNFDLDKFKQEICKVTTKKLKKGNSII